MISKLIVQNFLTETATCSTQSRLKEQDIRKTLLLQILQYKTTLKLIFKKFHQRRQHA